MLRQGRPIAIDYTWVAHLANVSLEWSSHELDFCQSLRNSTLRFAETVEKQIIVGDSLLNELDEQ